jgi:peptidoglycan/xylan/chitin deacetylase (PgdA/CDA1 family)/murein DD-endopeptidase MepM/ murein hydrolase activator NlpD
MFFKRIAAILLAFCLFMPTIVEAAALDRPQTTFIKWVDFTVPASLMKQALAVDDTDASWIELLAYLGAKSGGDFKKVRLKTLKALTDKLKDGETMESLTENMKHYGYYLEAYTAVLGGLAGPNGLTAYHPIANGFGYNHYDDFGNGRSYGYKRRHLGHDFMALTGTPVIAVESGVVEELGWNQYGGWRVGIRSFDSKRYYYYAHLRKNRPYAEGLEKGNTVQAGDVIGYVGRTGYSRTENTNGITESHLHFGIQLIFDESQKDGVNQIWIDPYEISKLLASRRSEVTRNDETKEYTRATNITGCTVPVPVVMYHSIKRNRSKLGTYTISPDELEQDLRWLKANGYQTVTVGQLLRYTEKGGPLPEKPVLLTFDDGHYDNVHYADPLLKQYDFTALVFVVGEFIDQSEAEGVQNPNYSYSNYETLRKLAKEDTWEIGSHSYGLHHKRRGREGVKRAHGESDESYYALLREDFSKIGELIEGITGDPPRTFAYPLGAMSAEAEKVLKEMGYKMTLSCSLGIAEVGEGDPGSLYKMKRILRSHKKPLSGFLRG